MLLDVNIPPSAGKLNRKHLLAHGHSICSTRKEVGLLGNKDYLPLTAIGVIKMTGDNPDVPWMYKNFEDVVIYQLQLMNTATDVQSLDMIVGGDHGQEAMRFPIK